MTKAEAAEDFGRFCEAEQGEKNDAQEIFKPLAAKWALSHGWVGGTPQDEDED